MNKFYGPETNRARPGRSGPSHRLSRKPSANVNFQGVGPDQRSLVLETGPPYCTLIFISTLEHSKFASFSVQISTRPGGAGGKLGASPCSSVCAKTL